MHMKHPHGHSKRSTITQNISHRLCFSIIISLFFLFLHYYYTIAQYTYFYLPFTIKPISLPFYYSYLCIPAYFPAIVFIVVFFLCFYQKKKSLFALASIIQSNSSTMWTTTGLLSPTSQTTIVCSTGPMRSTQHQRNHRTYQESRLCRW